MRVAAECLDRDAEVEREDTGQYQYRDPVGYLASWYMARS